MEVGIGHHVSRGINVTALKTAKEIADEMLDLILPDLPFESGDEVVVLLSGLGATPVMEQYIVYEPGRRSAGRKRNQSLSILRRKLFHISGNDGVTLTVMKLDDELKECIDMPVNSAGLKQF